MFIIKKILFINNILGNNWQFDPCIFWAVHMSIQVNVFDIEARKRCAWMRKSAVYYQILLFQRLCQFCNIPRVADTISWHRYVSMIGVIRVMSDLTHHNSVIYLLPTVVRNIFKFMTRKVSVTLTRCFFFPLVPLPTSWQNRPSSSEKDVFQTLLYFRW